MRIPPDNPRAAYCRDAIAARRLGSETKCVCGENSPRAFVKGSEPPICIKCDRKLRGHEERDDHHCFGAINSDFTMSVPVNDHRAELTAAQYAWPKQTLENPDRSPLLAAAAQIRGFADTMMYMIREFILPIATMLEYMDTMLPNKLGKKWWKHTKLKAFEPKAKGKRTAASYLSARSGESLPRSAKS
jgi:hypothetical protein